ncbi:MAG: TIGR04013 family B12-binding domain/radical SAM domain-containing protein [Candidatus Thorarchaeota archaeon]
MDVETSFTNLIFVEKDLAIVFRYSRANIYSYHALIGALEINSKLNQIPIFVPIPELFFDEIDRLLSIESFSNIIIGLSMHTFQLQENVEIINQLNQHPLREKITIIVGGPHPSARPEDLLKIGADFVVIGEGERTFPELIITLVNNLPIGNLKGIAYKEENEIIKLPPNNPIDLNDYPPFAPRHRMYSALEITRGCSYNCKYCQTPKLFGHNVRYRTPDQIIKWGKFLLSKRANWDFRFITPNAFGYYSKKSSQPNILKIEELLHGLSHLEAKNRKRIFFGTFPSEVRPESITQETLELTRKYCDNTNLTLGAQSGSPEILKQINRGHTVEQVLEAVDLAKRNGFTLNIDFIIGYPEETEGDQFLTLELCKKLLKKNCKLHMHYLIPLPGTEYENTTPSAIHPEILKILRKWSNNGKIFGSWQHQYDIITNNFPTFEK